MLFLLHVHPMASATESPEMSRETAEFILQCTFECASQVVLDHISRQNGFGPRPEVVVK